ncbi:MAG TPA: galactokinase [Candidatus Acidoferrales bacterium]|nr:galactokinase [Candidatus Acidoferrales bacterium]
MTEAFRKRFGGTGEVRVFRAPGRVNLIGEHTDYNLGFVLPVALDLATYVATAPSGDGKMRIHSEDRGETREFDASSLPGLPRAHSWADYPVGVAQELLRAGVEVDAANFLIRSTVPEGSGLSSSAALEVSSALALLRGRVFDPLRLARLCQSAERNFVGMPCGIMDQYISVFGREHCAVEIDCRSLTHRLVTLPDGIAFVAVNSMVKHALAGSAYKDRVAECKAACEMLGAASLRDVTPRQLAENESGLPEPARRRARHVVTENDRVHSFVDAAVRGDLDSMGRLMIESHRSLQHDYEVSCPELDFLVDSALSIDGVIGSRMTGGGFGGCTVTLLRAGTEPLFRREIAARYHSQFRIDPRIYNCTPAAGAGEVVWQ